jgi:4-aminobutyrate aminotransferase-like enzyme
LVQDDGHTPAPEALVALGKYALDHELMILPCGPDVNIIRFIPPLNVSTEELDLGIDTLADALAAYES